MGCIYKITNLVNGKAYIGQTYRKVEKRVIQEHLRGGSPGCRLLTSAIKKYGVDNFAYEILHDGILPEFLDTFEIEAIKSHNTLAPNGYNLQTGGAGGLWSEESREKMRGKNNPHYGKSPWNKGISPSKETREKLRQANLGKKASAETRQKMSKAHRGKNNPFYGKKHSDESLQKMSQSSKNPSAETRQKISVANKGRPSAKGMLDKKHSAETRQKMSKAHKGKPVHPHSLKNLRFPKKVSLETRQKISEAKKGKPANNRGPYYDPAHTLFCSLPETVPLSERRKILRERFPNVSYHRIWNWVKKWRSEGSS